MSRKSVTSENAPKAVGPYSHAVWAGELLFLSGQVPLDPATSKLVDGDVTAQTQQVFKNLEAVLKTARLSMDDVVKVNVFLTSMKNFQAVNAVYQTHFKAPCPARSAVAVAELPLGAMIEIELIAKKP